MSNEEKQDKLIRFQDFKRSFKSGNDDILFELFEVLENFDIKNKEELDGLYSAIENQCVAMVLDHFTESRNALERGIADLKPTIEKDVLDKVFADLNSRNLNGEKPIKGVDYSTDEDAEEIVEKVFKKIPTTKNILEEVFSVTDGRYVSFETLGEVSKKLNNKFNEETSGKSIVDKINLLPIEPDEQIDASHIKNWPKSLEIIKTSEKIHRGGQQITVKDEGTILTSRTTAISFVGAGVTATNNGGDVTVNIPSSSLTGADTRVLFFDGANTPAGDAGLTYNKTTDMLSAGGLTATDGAVLEKVVTLTDGATVALNAALGNVFNLTASGNRTILAPSNPTDGQRIIINILASGANRTITLTTGADAFVFSSYVASLPVITSAKVLSVVARYSSLISLWIVLAENSNV